MSIYHIIYKTHHKNGKFYYGRHTTFCLDDGYMGSGKWVKSIKNKSDLIRTIVDYAKNFDDLLELEKKYIMENVNNPLCMNYLPSAKGFAPKELNPMYGIKGNNHPSYGRKPTEKELEKMRKPKSSTKNMGKFKRTPEIIEKMKNNLKIVRSAPEYKQKRSEISSKKYIVTEPNGIQYEIKNLKMFCKENNISYGCMKEVDKGRAKQHKGWKCSQLK